MSAICLHRDGGVVVEGDMNALLWESEANKYSLQLYAQVVVEVKVNFSYCELVSNFGRTLGLFCLPVRVLLTVLMRCGT